MKRILRKGEGYALTKHKRKQTTIRYFSLLAVLTTMCLYAHAQRLDSSGPVLSGIVMDTAGTAISGATIIIKGTAANTVTNDRGQFTLRSPRHSGTLRISHIGHQLLYAQFNADNFGPYSLVLLPQENVLEEVEISTGYQKVSGDRLIGSYEKIDSATFNRKVGSDVLSRLEDNSGILFDNRNETPNLQIRGLSTLTEAIAQPLIILDNFPYSGDVNLLNPNDIADVTILKDAAAASMWGARAGNGVIVITTKKAVRNQSLRIDGNANITSTRQPDLFSLPIISSPDLIELHTELFKKGAYNSYLNSYYGKPPLAPVVEILVARAEGLISEADSASQMAALYGNDVRRDFEQHIYRNAVNQQFQIGVSAGSERLANRFSVGFDKELTNLIGNINQRITLVNSGQLHLTPRLTVETMLQYQYGQVQQNSLGGFESNNYNLNGGDGSYLSWQIPTYARLVDNEGRSLAIDKYRRGYIDTVGQGQLLDWNFRPLDELRNNDHTMTQHVMVMDAGLTYRPIDGLDASVKFRYLRNAGETRYLHNENSFYARDLINRFTNLGAAIEQDKYPLPVGGILESQDNLIASYYLRGQINFQRDINRHHWVSAIAGAEINQIRNKSSSQTTYGFNERLNVAAVDYLSQFPTPFGWTSAIPNGTSFSGLLDRYVSFYANASYAYKKRYTVYGSTRNDATNLFGVNQRNRWRPLWSVGAGWAISQEPFYRFAALPHLKLRLTYGYQGNVNNAYSAYTTISNNSAVGNMPINIPYASVASPGNPDLRWEKTRQVNAALEFGTKGGWLTATVDVFSKWSIDLISRETMDPTIGYPSVTRNSASLVGKGAELNIQVTPIAHRMFKWKNQLRFNYSSYKVSDYLVKTNTDGFVSDGKIMTPLVGYNPFLVVSYRWAGLDPSNGDPQGYFEGNVSSDWNNIAYYTPFEEQIVHGAALPTMFGNWLATTEWGPWALSMNISYKLGYYFRRPTISYASLFANRSIHADYLDRWRKPGDEAHTNVPSLIYPNPSSSRDDFYLYSAINVAKGDHIRLRDVRISHTYKRFQFYGYLSNLNLLIWHANHLALDPEYPNGMEPGLSYSFGCVFNF